MQIAAENLAPLDERLVQAIWNDQLLKSDVLVTADGRPITVFDAGQWNGEAGPDFRSADLAIGGQRFRGDVEIHVYSGDWDRHGHQNDFEYNNVVLHVVLHRDDDRAHDDLHNGSYVPRLVLEGFLEPDLTTIRQSLAGEEYFHAPRDPETGPRCHLEVAQLTDGELADWLDEAARARMKNRVARVAAQAQTSGLDQAVYQSILTALGHRGSKTLFFLLARRASLADLQNVLAQTPAEELPLALEGILLHVSGLAAHRTQPDLDAESAAYVAMLADVWGRYGRYFSDKVIPPTRRWMTGIRPVSFPSRRITGAARFLAATGFRGGLVAYLADVFRASAARQPRTAKDFKREIAGLRELFVSEDASFWTHRYTIGGKPSKSALALIGEDQALSILFNAVLPAMFFYAAHMGDDLLEKYLWRIHAHFPALQANTVTRYMRGRLFAGSGVNRPGVTFRLEAQNQGLIHIFQECCTNQDLTCADCAARKRCDKAAGRITTGRGGG